MTKSVQIKNTEQKNKLSAAQKKFNQLIKNIETERKQLQAWQAIEPECLQKIHEELTPIQQAYAAQQAQMVVYLDELHASYKLTANQRDKLSAIIVEMCLGLISNHDFAELKPLYNKHSDGDFDKEEEEDRARMHSVLRSMVQQETGFDLGEDTIDLKDIEGSKQRLLEKMQAFQAQQEAAQATRKKSAKALAKEEKAQAKAKEEEANISKSLQAVYRQLVAALHPDREQDPVERERKTELMKQVTVAYDNKNLLKLLELQLNVEQIDQHKINNIAEDRLKHYNKILQQQLAELSDEVEMIAMRYKHMLNLMPFQPLTPTSLLRRLQIDISSQQSGLERLKQEFERFKDVKAFKLWLKKYEFEFDEPGFGFGFEPEYYGSDDECPF